MKLSLLALAMIALASAPATAMTIVDTGTPPSLGVALGLDNNQWLAAKFTAPTSTLTDLTLFSDGSIGETFHVALYTASGDTPGTELFSAVTSLTAGDSFNGVHGVSWKVTAGDYFVAFEVRSGDTLLDGRAPDQAPFPLAVEAYADAGIYANAVLNLGIRVDGTVDAVPEPATWSLLITGFALSGVALRRRRSVAA